MLGQVPDPRFRLDRRFILIDTFEGIPEGGLGPSEKLALGHNKEYIDYQSYEKTKDHFAKYPQIEVVQGRVPNIPEKLDIPEICFLHIDMNNDYAERAGLEALWDRIVPNGVVVFDDYGFAGYEAQTDTIDEFVASVGERVCVLPSGQGFLIKR